MLEALLLGCTAAGVLLGCERTPKGWAVPLLGLTGLAATLGASGLALAGVITTAGWTTGLVLGAMASPFAPVAVWRLGIVGLGLAGAGAVLGTLT